MGKLYCSNDDGGSGGVSDDNGMKLVTCFSYKTIKTITK